MTIPPGTPEEEVEQSLAEALAEELGVSTDSVTVDYDPETGEVTFKITSDDLDTLNDLKEKTKDSEFVEKVNEKVDVEGVDVTGVTTSETNNVNIEVSVDADTTGDPEQAVEDMKEYLDSNNYDHESAGKFHNN